MLRVRELRESKGIQQKELAVDLGVSQPTVSDWESGRKVPSAKSMAKLADYFGVSVDYLLGRENEKEPTPESESGLSKTAQKIMECVGQMSEREQETFLAWLQASQGRD